MPTHPDTSASDTFPQPPSYEHGAWYSPHGHDWQYVDPKEPRDEVSWLLKQSFPREGIGDDLSHVHHLLLDIDYGVIDEPAQESGITAACGFLLRDFLRSRAAARSGQRQGEEITFSAFLGGMPVIHVVVGKSQCEFIAIGTDTVRLREVWEDLALAFDTPHVIYRSDDIVVGARAATLMRETQIMSTALMNRHEVYTGALWHNDVALRTGINGAALAPLDIWHLPHRVYPAITRLLGHVHPSGGRVRHAFQTSDATLMGEAFTRPPRPMSEEDFLADTEAPRLAFPQAGYLETDDGQALLSASFPLTSSALIASDILAHIVAQLLHETVGERAQLRAERYVHGDEMVLVLAAGGDWSVEDTRALMLALFGCEGMPEVTPESRMPSYLLEQLPDERIAELLEGYTITGRFERLLYMRRIEREALTPEVIREQLALAFDGIHLPEPVVRGHLVALFPPLVPPRLMMGAYGSGQGVAFPPPLEADDLARSFYEDEGQHFRCRLHLKTDEMPFFAPDRLTISPQGIALEWFNEHRPSDTLRRRVAFEWAEVRAWVTVGEAIALMDHAGRVMFIIPTIFDRVGPLYDALREREHALAAAGVLMLRGGERELRGHVRRVVQAASARQRSELKQKVEAQHVLSNPLPVMPRQGGWVGAHLPLISMILSGMVGISFLIRFFLAF